MSNSGDTPEFSLESLTAQALGDVDKITRALVPPLPGINALPGSGSRIAQKPSNS